LVAAVCVALLGFAHPAAAQSPLDGHNLLVNPGAETGEAVDDATSVLAPIGWTADAQVTQVHYGASGGFPSAATGAEIGGGSAFFAGGPPAKVSNPSSRVMTQEIDVSAAATAIDGGTVRATLSGLLGGYGSEADATTVNAYFVDAGDVTLEIGPVTAADRANQITLLAREDSAMIPSGARSILVSVTFERLSVGSYNDAYADNLSLTLHDEAPVPPPVPVVHTTGTAQITTGSAQIHGTIDDHGNPTGYHVEYGRDVNYGHVTPNATTLGGAGATAVHQTIDGLQPDTEYHARLVADHPDGPIAGEDISLRSLSGPATSAETPIDPGSGGPTNGNTPTFGSPNTTVISGASGPTWATAPSFEFASSVPGSAFLCRVDDGPWSTCLTGWIAGVLSAGPHTFAVRAISPERITDPTPAVQAFTVREPETQSHTCRHPAPATGNSPGILRSNCWVFRSRGDGDPCLSYERCRWTTDTCPQGARCTLTAKVKVRGYGWNASSHVGSLTPEPSAIHLGYYAGPFSPYCRTANAFGGTNESCTTSVAMRIFGTGKPVGAFCELRSPGREQFVADCTATLTISPATPLQPLAVGQAVEVYAAGAGVLATIATIGSPSRSSAAPARRRPARPQIAPVRLDISRAGPVALDLKLNTAARKLLRRKNKLAVTLRSTFTPTSGTPMTKTSRVTLKQPSPAARTQRCVSRNRCPGRPSTRQPT